MKINIEDKSPYNAVIDAIHDLAEKNEHGLVCDKIVRIKTSNLGESNEPLFVSNAGDDYSWLNDWYEGGDVELLGYINVEDVDVPMLSD